MSLDTYKVYLTFSSLLSIQLFYFKFQKINSSKYTNFNIYHVLTQGHGFRSDLFQMVANLKPKVFRFPGTINIFFFFYKK
jgi:alpha-L-arabinofuranosidase